jgi:hypothetical protein
MKISQQLIIEADAADDMDSQVDPSVLRKASALLEKAEAALSITSLTPAHCNCSDCKQVRKTLAAIREELK